MRIVDIKFKYGRRLIPGHFSILSLLAGGIQAQDWLPLSGRNQVLYLRLIVRCARMHRMVSLLLRYLLQVPVRGGSKLIHRRLIG